MGTELEKRPARGSAAQSQPPENQGMTEKEIAAEWAKTLLQRNKWCILDTETTGLDTHAEICEIAVIAPDIPHGWRTYVRPLGGISRNASRIHGIEDRDVQDASTFDQVFLQLMRRVGNKDLVIYNSEFDLQFIKQSLKPHGIQLAFPNSDRRKCRIFTNGGSIHDAMLWYSQWVGEWNDYFGNYKWQKLPGGDHSALGDCKATLEIIKQMAQS